MPTALTLDFALNGHRTTWQVAPGETLLESLRRHGLHSVKHGCETGDCGTCTVLVDGVARNSCVMLAMQAHGRSVTTLESLGRHGHLHPLQEAFVKCGAVQCGYCTPGMILSAVELLSRYHDPTADDARDALSGNYCRCTGYVKPVQAVLAAAQKLRERDVAASAPASLLP